MLGHKGGEKVKAGTYWSVTTGELASIPQQGVSLPGGAEERYIRAPLPLMMLLGPLAGAAYVIFLPFIGFATVAAFLGQRSWQGARAGGRAVTHMVAIPTWAPGIAHLTRRRAHPGRAEAPAKAAPERTEDELTALEKDIEARRREQEKS
jgi:hypothetical protein